MFDPKTLWGEVKSHLAEWATIIALFLVVLRLITPSFVDLIFDIVTVGLVYAVGKMVEKKDKT